jgi:hypothetical protein
MKSKRLSFFLITMALFAALVWWIGASRNGDSNNRAAAAEKEAATPRSQRPLAPQQTQSAVTNLKPSASNESIAEELNRLHVIDQSIGGDRVTKRLLKWIETDPDAAFDWALRTGKDGKSLSGFVVEVVASSDIEKAIAMFERLTDPRSITNARGKIVLALSAKDPDAALTYALQESDPNFKARLFSHIATNLAERDLEGTMKQWASEEDESARIGMATGIAAAWAKQDLPAALAWAEQLPDMEKNLALREIGPLWVKNDPAAAMAHLTGGSKSRWLQGPAVPALEAWTRLDPHAAAEWLEQSDFKEDYSATYTLYTAWMDSEPLEAAQSLQSLEDDEARDLLTALAIERLAARSLQDAVAFTESIPDPDSLKAVIHGLIPKWVSQDPQAAAAWVSGFEDESAQMRGTLSIALHASAGHPALSSEWLAKIQDPKLRDTLIDRVGPLWLNHDETEGHRLLQESGVPPERIAELQRNLEELRLQ